MSCRFVAAGDGRTHAWTAAPKEFLWQQFDSRSHV